MFKSVDVSETKNMVLFHGEPMKRHIDEQNISLISIISLMYNYTKP